VLIVLLKDGALLIAFIIPLKIKILIKYVVSSMIQTPKPIYLDQIVCYTQSISPAFEDLFGILDRKPEKKTKYKFDYHV
jgi:hypothetical protein